MFGTQMAKDNISVVADFFLGTLLQLWPNIFLKLTFSVLVMTTVSSVADVLCFDILLFL